MRAGARARPRRAGRGAHGEELERAVAAGATLIGINNRDLRTFVTTLATAERLRPLMPAGASAVAESGIETAADIARLRARRRATRS